MESITIPKQIESLDDRDYDFLRREGLEHIEALSHKFWTDYNSHDPGITILEALCYAITDLGHRINLPILDLLTKEENSSDKLAGNFPTAKQILTSKPVTEVDYRKLFIDIAGVNNVFMHVNADQILYRHCLEKDEPTAEEPQGIISYEEDLSPDYKKFDSSALKGLYSIYFEPDHDIKILLKDDDERKALIEEIEAEIKRLYHTNRNLCEDLVEVNEVSYFDVLVCGDIEIERTANAAGVMAEILFRVQEYLSPSVKRYSLGGLMNEGLPVESIYDGPVLQNGFIPDEELNKAAIKKEIRLSDLIQIVSETPGVKNIRKLKMGACNGSEIPGEVRDKSKQKWTLCLPKDSVILPRLCTEKSVRTTNLFKDVIPVPVDYDTVEEKMNTLIEAHQESLSLSYDDLPAESGHYIETGYYRSVQNDLPQLYGTGEYGLSPSLPPERHARAKQMKSYLLFFDQILASYFGHLRNMGDLLSAEVGSGSYFISEVSDVNDVDDLKKNSASYHSETEKIFNDLDDFEERKNRFLDHMLSRFAEDMNEYVFAMMEKFGEDLTSATLWHKSVLLKEYPEVSSNRARALNYFEEDSEPWDTFDVSGFKHRIARLLGIRDYSRRNLTDYNFEIYQDEDDADDEWRWRVFDEDDSILFSASTVSASEHAAGESLWAAVTLAWDPKNYVLRQTEDDEEFFFSLADENQEVVARFMKLFSSEEEAMAQIKPLSDYIFERVSEEGMFLFEHILFRPDRDDDEADGKFMHICMDSECRQCKPTDPYSLRLSIVFPGWTRRFSNLYFREYAENLIRREVPAHIICRICWIGNTIELEDGEINTENGPMQQLQDLYKKWLTKKRQSPENQKENEFLKPLVDMLHDLVTIYPAGRLYDCKTGDDEESESPIVLGKSTIGELKNKKNGDE
ncbi:hypothetical protein BH23BAC3_BH23BAC3_07710 [soil metagenome]